jgi:hypothetical protein
LAAIGLDKTRSCAVIGAGDNHLIYMPHPLPNIPHLGITRLFDSLFESARRHPHVLPPSVAALGSMKNFSRVVFFFAARGFCHA